ncbi:class I SAM-dependent methyltransferase [Roseateles violae]|uniref:Class I SAM-dependent methyltransferase n=1 Tax=Roseateles violae TaxID=3058042 RepID=A0ABT8DTW9_9BURK|nr:class I SAM-dependent methyltransferase [Pelomonas sp. PFR6]MDN3920475.1 class I SAM-dependent methyltransferase [Pelomonas sp. PFR6]
MSTESVSYTRELQRKEGIWWKRLIPVQLPYRWNLQRLRLGFVLDLGCGIGRNLRNLDGNGVGVDHNDQSVQTSRLRGYRAFTPAQFMESPYARCGTFDSLLLSHVAEHMHEDECIALLNEYLPFVRPSGQVVLICPQEAGYASDATHVQFMDFEALTRSLAALGISPERSYSFPLPRSFGRFFKYNEFVAVGKVPAMLNSSGANSKGRYG